MQVTAKYVNAPKNNSKYGSIKTPDGKYYGFVWADFKFEQGGTYDVETKDRDVDGKTYTSIIRVNKSASNGNGAATGDRWWMPFVSNTVAHAIAANIITEPGLIKVWAAAAKQAALEIEIALKARTEDDFPDDIPYDH